ncbi:related to PHO89-Na+/phosphate co-transporter [Rhynchosporium agropyri]|uniref:Phosphate transporter n=3 Tax=Rhynchosporium TaxID=38037 RepID=A0A1E1MUY6_RHYSE|nr:related to PHO89-Na+/phosphate co-transporter [Rhynchosporium agropyri]CZT07823.1 related to PHO89-Na+/phosphate co-transporter [Rhynchosporium commune]CZT52882.1 related to PHO89-Na+/phosphate co-transporter [Rhynchosporium secalis]
MAVLEKYTYVFAIGTMFALLEAYNNGANDVANAWATSVSSRSVTYRQAMFLCVVFELVGALAVGARTASTIKNGIIPIKAFHGDADVQLLAFACASAGAAIWVMWCTRNSAHVSSTYSLVSSIAGVGVAAVGVNNVEWGWSKGSGLGAIFAGLCMAPVIAGSFGAIIFSLIKYTVHKRSDPVKWAVFTSPFFFLIAGTICTLSIVYKGSPKLGLDKKPPAFIAGVTLGVGFSLFVLSGLFFVPYVFCKVIKKDYTLKITDIWQGPALFTRVPPADAAEARVPNYNVVQEDEEEGGELAPPATLPTKNANIDAIEKSPAGSDKDLAVDNEKLKAQQAHSQAAGASNLEMAIAGDNPKLQYKLLLARAEERHHAHLRQSRGPLGWAMRHVYNNRQGPGEIYELHNMKAAILRLPAYVVIAACYGFYYDIHRAQVGILGTPEGRRMAAVYDHAHKYKNEVEYLYSFVQIITACTASFAHGANDVGNAVGVWAGMYGAWSTGKTVASKADVPLWQIAVVALMICFGFITYGYNIMKVMGNKITYHSPSRGSSMEMGAAVTILIFSQYKLPVSTSMCITGATVGVGLCNGTYKAVNWQRVGLLFFSWVVTIPIAGLIGGCLMALMLNSPHYGN